MADDCELLRRYASEGSEEAFAELVHRRLDFVYSVAVRQVGGDAHLAQDVVQRVFSDLARKAGPLSQRPVLTGWLYRSAQFAASDLVRAERRRRAREAQAHALEEIMKDDSPDWERMRPVLDRAMGELNDRDRDAVMLRFFEGKAFAEVGARLHLTEDAARVRVVRAIEKLRALLAKQGLTSTAAALAVAIASQGAVAAPASLGTSVLKGASAAGQSVGWLTVILMNQAKVTIGVAAVLALAGALFVQERKLESLYSRLGLAERAAATGGRGTRIAPEQSEPARNPLATAVAAVTGLGLTAGQVAEVRELQALQRRGALDNSHAALFRQLNLDAETLEALKDFLVERNRRITEARSFVDINVASVTDPDFEPFSRHLRPIATREIDGQIRALLGEERFAAFEAFDRRLDFRKPVAELAEYLENIEPLGDEREARILDLIVEALPDVDAAFANGPYVIPDSVIDRAAAFLSPFQLGALKRAQAVDAAGRRMHELNWAAASSGRVQLSERNKLFYPSASNP